MNTDERLVGRLVQGQSISIGTLAELTGLSVATLRVWERRHRFPSPVRLEGGHRRYKASDVAAVRDVMRRREAGVRLDVAIDEAIVAARERAQPTAPSVYAELRRRHPGLATHRLRKSTMLALSWAIEDEFCARADRADVFGLFQTKANYAASRSRWAELDRVSGSTFVFADFPRLSTDGGPVRVPLGENSPMRREWALVCESIELPAALTGWELPGQEGSPDRERVYEALWTVEPTAVRDAARVCARVASEAGAASAESVMGRLSAPVAAGVPILTAVTTMFNRVVAYVDSLAGVSGPPRPKPVEGGLPVSAWLPRNQLPRPDQTNPTGGGSA